VNVELNLLQAFLEGGMEEEGVEKERRGERNNR
jgi:hypothetical protein